LARSLLNGREEVKLFPPKAYITGAIMTDVYLTIKQAAAYLHLSVSFLRKQKRLSTGPKVMRFGSRLYYRKADLDAWAESTELLSAFYC
jgi:hypothetical protein